MTKRGTVCSSRTGARRNDLSTDALTLYACVARLTASGRNLDGPLERRQLRAWMSKYTSASFLSSHTLDLFSNYGDSGKSTLPLSTLSPSSRRYVLLLHIPTYSNFPVRLADREHNPCVRHYYHRNNGANCAGPLSQYHFCGYVEGGVASCWDFASCRLAKLERQQLQVLGSLPRKVYDSNSQGS